MSSKKKKFNTEVSEFSQFLIHDLRNPLQIVTGLSDLLLNPAFKNVYKGEEREKKIESLNQSLVDFNNTLTQLGNFANKNMADQVSYDLADLIITKSKMFNIETDLKIIKAPLEGFPDSMSKALDEVVKNAIEGNSGAKIPILTLDIEDNSYVITIINNGQIKEVDLVSMHKPFYTTKENHDGIGLTYARQIFKNHAGSVDILNENDMVYTKIKIPTKNS